MRSGERETGAVVVKRGVQPGSRVMALVAGLGEVRRHMVWISRSLIILQVTTDAGCGRQVVVVVDVAIRALPRRHRVHAGQRESCEVVIKRGVGP